MKRRSNNEGSIYQRQSDKRWVVHYPMPGRDKPIVKYCKTEKEAVKTLRELVRSDAYIDPNTTTLSEWMEKWLLDYVEGTISDNFYLRKKDLVRLHVDPYIGKIRLQKLMTDDIRAYYKRLLRSGKKVKTKDEHGNQITTQTGLSPQTLRHVHNILKPALDAAVERDLIIKNPINKSIKLPAIDKIEYRTLSEDEIGKYFKGLSHRRLYAAFVLELCTGLRRGELLGVKWEDLNFETRELKIKRQVARVRDKDQPNKSSLEYTDLKTKSSERTIILALCAVEELRAHQYRQNAEKELAGKSYKDEGLVFCSPLGQKLDTRRFYEIHCQTLKREKMEHIPFHNLRHTVATLLLEKGEDIKTIQDLLGHADPATTMQIYIHVTDKRRADCADNLGSIIGSVIPSNLPDSPNPVVN